ncbi:hypothetical protein FOHLNKBM_6023 [Methylobacterium longum]|nr:hypothetical protein FOHLNKBM_6023 [Methylobacterium longum]
MRADRLLVTAATLTIAVLPVRADQVLGPGRIIGSDPANGDILFGALKFGKRHDGKTTLQPDAMQISGPGSSGDILLGMKPVAPTLSQGFDLTPALGTKITISDGTDAAPRTGTDPTPSIFISRADKSTPGAGFQGRLLGLHYKRLDGGNGSVQAARFRTDDYSTTVGSQTVGLTGISNVFGKGQGWALYGEAWSHKPTATATTLELDASNNSGGDFTYNDASPLTVPHTKALIIAGKKGSVPTNGRNTMAMALVASPNAEFQTFAYIAPKTLLKYGFDFAASPPTGILFRNGASTDGLGTTPGGIGIDMGPNNKGYGTAPDQGAIHLRTHRLLAGKKVSEGGTGLTYLDFNTATNLWQTYAESGLGPRFGAASGYATIYAATNGLLLRDYAGTNQLNLSTAGVSFANAITAPAIKSPAAGNGVLTSAFIRTTDPTTKDIPVGQCADWNNITAATFKHVCNVGGTLRSVAME